MNTKQFSLDDVIEGVDVDFEPIQIHAGTWRWGTIKDIVFKADGKFWRGRVFFHTTEGVCDSNGKFIKCTEVHEVEKAVVVKAWEPVT